MQGEYAKVNIFNLKILKEKKLVYADFESNLGVEDNRKHSPNKSCTNKYQKHVACSYGYELVCVDEKFSKPFK